MGPVVLDTSVLSAAFDPSDAHHSGAVAAITERRLARQPIRISAVSVAEFHSVRGSGRDARIAWLERFVESLGATAIAAVDRRTAEIAGELRARRPSVKLPDALIKATADLLGGELLTADRKLSKLDGVILLRTRA